MTETEKLEAEAQHATELLRGKSVARIDRHRPGELLVEFTDHSRLFVDLNGDALEISITGTETDE